MISEVAASRPGEILECCRCLHRVILSSGHTCLPVGLEKVKDQEN